MNTNTYIPIMQINYCHRCFYPIALTRFSFEVYCPRCGARNELTSSCYRPKGVLIK